MIIFGIGITLAAYAVGLWGYILLRGYCITFIDVINPNYPASIQSATASAPAGTGGGGGTDKPVSGS